MNFPVRYQLVVQTHDGNWHLFERNDELPAPPHPGMLFVNLKYIPNVVGPDCGYDNIAKRVVVTGKKDGAKVVLVQLQGYRAATETIDEVIADMPGWEHIAKGINVRDTGEMQDPLNG